MTEGIEQRRDGIVLWVVKVIISAGNSGLWDARKRSEPDYIAMVLEQVRITDFGSGARHRGEQSAHRLSRSFMKTLHLAGQPGQHCKTIPRRKI